MGHTHNLPNTSARSGLALATLLTLGYAAVEAGVGFWAGSLALVADAGHMVSDVVSILGSIDFVMGECDR